MPDPEFKTRSEPQIARDMENAMLAQTRLSDFSPAAVLAVLARESVAPEVSQIYDHGLTVADSFYIDRPANTGSALDRRLSDFGLSRRQATTAYGVVTLYRKAGELGAETINAGHRLAARDAEGNTVEFTIRGPLPAGVNPDIASAPAGNVVLADGQALVYAVVDAVLSGSAGSVGSNAIVEWVDPQPARIGAPAGGTPATGLTNPRAFTTGKDQDSDNEARQLFFDWLTAKARCTPAALRLAATTYKQIVNIGGEERAFRPVTSASVVEHLDNPGAGGVAATLYVMGVNGNHVSDTVLTALQQRVDGYTDTITGEEVEGWRAAGIKVQLDRPNLLEAVIRVQLIGATDLQRETLRLRLTSYVAGLPIGGPIQVADIFGEVCKIGSVDNALILSPEVDLPAGPTDKWIPAGVEVT